MYFLLRRTQAGPGRTVKLSGCPVELTWLVINSEKLLRFGRPDSESNHYKEEYEEKRHSKIRS